MNYREIIEDIFISGIDSIRVGRLFSSQIKIDGNLMRIKDDTYDLSKFGDVYLVGFGKASSEMAGYLEKVMGDRIDGGLIITKYGHVSSTGKIRTIEAGHPIPDENSVLGANEIRNLVHQAKEDDLIFCLISGGGSSLLTDIPGEISLEDLKTLNSILLSCGASISEINCIRKKISDLKGGGLGKMAYPATVVSLILSDIIGDPLSDIASGPTVEDMNTYADAIDILLKYDIYDKIPTTIREFIEEGSRNEAFGQADKELLDVKNYLIGNNTVALEAAKKKAQEYGFKTYICNNAFSGDVREVVDYLESSISEVYKEGAGKKVCLLFGGESTVLLTKPGKGGRNQHLALLFAKYLLPSYRDITFLAAGTDGTDGPTDAAGAIVDRFTLEEDIFSEIDKYIENFESYKYFKKEGGLLITGPTGTNVMDMLVILIDGS